jgi:hypothetical protein
MDPYTLLKKALTSLNILLFSAILRMLHLKVLSSKMDQAKSSLV